MFHDGQHGLHTVRRAHQLLHWLQRWELHCLWNVLQRPIRLVLLHCDIEHRVYGLSGGEFLSG